MNKENIFHVIKDPVHGTMQFTTTEDNWIKPFIDHPSFQRLRHVKQLGLGDFIFPGAVHTRFNHCLGCCYVASQIAHKIGLAEEERQLVMIACLLHDIGHGPFSHTFEDIFNQKAIKHETWTPFFLADFKTEEFFNAYNKRNPRHHLTSEKFLLIEQMIMHKSNSKPVLADIVSSQLDADRLDYLLRDSHFCGVTYGEFDFRWMLNCMEIIPTQQGERLGLTHKGVGVVEHYLMARRLMMRNIYFHHKKLALEFLLIKMLVNLAESIETYPAFSELKKTRLGKFLVAANQFNSQKNKEEFLQKNYINYKELCDYDVFSIIKFLSKLTDHHAAVQIAKRLQNRIIPKAIRLDPERFNEAQSFIKELKRKNKIEDWQLDIIKTPHQSYSMEEPIFVMTETEQIKLLTESSWMIQAMSDKLENTIFICMDMELYEQPLLRSEVERFLKK